MTEACAFALVGGVRPICNVDRGSFCVSHRRMARLPAATVPKSVVTMGLNAKSLAKAKKGGKKKGKGGSKGPTGTNPARAGNTSVDTNRREYIFQMRNVSKTLNNGKQILKDINLAYFPGAKIGVVGENGSGKVSAFDFLQSVEKRPPWYNAHLTCLKQFCVTVHSLKHHRGSGQRV